MSLRPRAEALGLAEEHRSDVPRLDVTSSDSSDLIEFETGPATRLFAMHARMVDRHFALDAANASLVNQICHRVGGLPLTIELAARQLDIVTIEELAQEAGSERFLSRLEVDSPLEHRLGSIAASLQWSLNLLSSPEQFLFASLGVFAGTFTREQALDLADARSNTELTRSFDRLVRLSLVTRDSPGSTRFRLFDPTKEFAIALNDPPKLDALRQRHARIMRDSAERFSPMLRTDREAQACSQLAADFPDHRQAVAWFFENSIDDAARMVVALFQFCQFQMLSEANDWAMRLTKMLDADSPMTVPIFGAAALGSWFSGDFESAIALGEQAIRAAPSRRDPSALWAHEALMDAKAYSGRWEDSLEHFEAIDAYGKQSGDRFWQVNSSGFGTIGWLLAGSTENAMQSAERAIALARELNNPDCTHWAMHCYGRALSMSDPEAACAAFEVAMEAAGSVGSRWNLSLDLIEWSSLKRQLNDIPRAAQGLLELLELLMASGNRSQRSQFYLEASLVLEAQGQVDIAYTIMAARAGMPGMPMTPGVADESFVSELEQAVGPKASQLRARARAMTQNDLLVLCRSRLEDIVGSQRLSTTAIADSVGRDHPKVGG